MSETYDAMPSNYADSLALDGDQTAAMRQQWIGLGLDPAAFDQAASQAASLPGNQAPPAHDANPPEVEVASGLGTPSLTPAQAQEMAAEMIRAGMPADQVNAALVADGYTAEIEDHRTDDEKVFDRAFSPARPEAYQLDFRGRVAPGMDLAGIAGANVEFTTWLSAVGFPPEIGPAVVERAIDRGQAYARMPDVERELWTREQQAALDRLTGSSERTEEVLGLALKTLARGGDDMWSALSQSGALIDAGIVMHLAHQEERRAFRSGK